MKPFNFDAPDIPLDDEQALAVWVDERGGKHSDMRRGVWAVKEAAESRMQERERERVTALLEEAAQGQPTRFQRTLTNLIRAVREGRRPDTSTAAPRGVRKE